MIVGILSTTDIIGGAAISAYRLFKGLERNNNVTVKMFVRHKHSDDTNVFELDPDNSIFSKIKRFKSSNNRFGRLKSLKEQHKIPWFSNNFSDVDLLNYKNLRDCDVINVHWTSEFTPLVNVLTAFPDKKIIVTLHDQHHFTGGCHYDMGCDKYFEKCNLCPQTIKLGIKDQTKYVFEERCKKYLEHNFKVIGPSKWICKLANRSRLFKDRDVFHIPYGLNLKGWKIHPKGSARKELNLPLDACIVLSGSVNPVNYVKGGDLLQKVQKLTPIEIGGRNLTHVTFGNKHDSFEDDVVQFGYVDDRKTMNLLYAAADVFCITSRYDNLPNTVLESMASGTPVIGFDVGGIPDMIEEGQTGFLVQPFNQKEFSQKITEFFMQSNEKRINQGISAREKVEAYFASEIEVNEYIRLFKDEN